MFDGVVIEPPYFNHLNDSSIAAWESLTNTYWMGNTVPIWTVYQFNYGREEWVNTLALDVLKQSSARPTSIRLSGSKDGVEWKELLFHSDRNLFKKTTHEEFRMMDHMDTFSSYKFEVLECSSELKRVTLSTIDLRVSRLDYCVMRDGFHGVMPAKHRSLLVLPATLAICTESASWWRTGRRGVPSTEASVTRFIRAGSTCSWTLCTL